MKLDMCMLYDLVVPLLSMKLGEMNAFVHQKPVQECSKQFLTAQT